VVGAALEVLAAEGLDAVTMRKVAQRLGTGAASLYAHVQDKAELHELMLDAVLVDIAIPAPDPANWKQQLKDVAVAMVDRMASRPGIARIALETLIPTTPTIIEEMDRLLAILRAGGLSDDDALAGADILSLYTAAAAYERGLRSVGGAEHEAAERIGRIRSYLEIVPAGRLPQLTALAPAMARQRDSFELGLDLILDGLAARAERPRTAAARD
jgi:AcrR family transcriptional regulator